MLNMNKLGIGLILITPCRITSVSTTDLFSELPVFHAIGSFMLFVKGVGPVRFWYKNMLCRKNLSRSTERITLIFFLPFSRNRQIFANPA